VEEADAEGNWTVNYYEDGPAGMNELGPDCFGDVRVFSDDWYYRTWLVWPEDAAKIPVEKDQNLSIAIGIEPDNLDPLKMMSAPAATVSEYMAQSLIYMSEEGSIEPSLALSWEPIEDGLAWDLELREGVTFHDGEPFNAEAVATRYWKP